VKVIQALGGGEEEVKGEEKGEEKMGEEQVEKAVVEDVHMEYRVPHTAHGHHGA